MQPFLRALLALLVFSFPAQAGYIDTVYSQDNWQVNVADEDGTLYCTLYSRNDADTGMSLSVMPDFLVFMLHFENGAFDDLIYWTGRSHQDDYTLRMAIDDEDPWTTSAQIDFADAYIASTWVKSPELVAFLDELYAGLVLRILDQEGNTLDVFSLRGSSQGLLALAECSEKTGDLP